MKYNYKVILLTFFLFFSQFVFSQSAKTTISGYVKDIKNGEGLIGFLFILKN